MSMLDSQRDRQIEALTVILCATLAPSAGLMLSEAEMRKITTRLRARVLIAAQLIEWEAQ